MKDAALKLRWQFSQKDGVSKFRAEVAAHSASINMLLATASVKLMKVNDEKLNARLSDAEQKTQTSLDNQDSILDEVRNRLEENNKLVLAGNAAARKIMDYVRLEWLKQLGVEVKAFMRKIIRINLATYRAVIAIQAGLPTRLERSLIQEPFILEDAIGRVAPVHLQFIDSWDAFDAVLELRFRDVQGFTKVCKKEYILQERATGREIDRSRCWKKSFLPGQRIDMSLIFKREVTRSQRSVAANCPRCQFASDKPTDLDTQCVGCGMWYRRITEMYEVEPPPSEPLPNPWKKKVQFGENPFGRVTSEPPPLKKRKADEMDAENGLADFKRIRLISRRKRVKKPLDFYTPYQVQSRAAWPTPLRSDGSAIQLNSNRASDIQSMQRVVSSRQGMEQQGTPSFQLTPDLFERTRPPEAGSLTKHARLIASTTLGIWTEVHRNVIEVEEEEETEDQEQKGKNGEDLEREDSFHFLNHRSGAKLSEIRDVYRLLM